MKGDSVPSHGTKHLGPGPSLCADSQNRATEVTNKLLKCIVPTLTDIVGSRTSSQGDILDVQIGVS